MSLGWQTESALLPSNSKKIEVDSKSILGLKALVYEKEQQRQSSSSSLTSTKYRRNNHGNRIESHSKTSKAGDLLRSNRGVEERRRSDEKHQKSTKKVDLVESSLRAKAEIYDKISKGNAPDSSNIFLVDFHGKEDTPVESHISSVDNYRSNADVRSSKRVLDELTSTDVAMSDDLADIVDHFGRSRTVSKSSQEYEDFQTSADANKFRQTMNEKAEKYSKTHLERNKQHKYTADDRDTVVSDECQWAWSSGRDRVEGVGDWVEDAIRARCYDDLVNDSIDREIESSRSKGSRVKTVWEEKTFDSDTRAFLDEIHADTQLHRSSHVVAGGQPTISHTLDSSSSTTASVTAATGNRKVDRLELLKRKLLEKEKKAEIF